jgi:hypothetical protein
MRVLNDARISMIDALADGIAAGAGNGTFRLFNNASPPVELVSITFNSPAFNPSTWTGAAIEALLNVSSQMLSNTYAGSTDTIGEYRIYDGDGNLILDGGSIQVSGGGYNVPTLTIENGYTYDLQSGNLGMTDF